MPQCLFPMSAGCVVFQFPSNGVPSGEAPAQAIVVPIPCGVPLHVCVIAPIWIPLGHGVRPFLRTLSDRTLPRIGGDSERASFVGRQLDRLYASPEFLWWQADTGIIRCSGLHL